MVDLPPNKSHYWFEQNADVNSVPKETSVNCHSNQGCFYLLIVLIVVHLVKNREIPVIFKFNFGIMVFSMEQNMLRRL